MNKSTLSAFKLRMLNSEVGFFPYLQACPGIDVADGIFVRAATFIVLTAGGSLKGAASPCKAVRSPLKKTAASVALRAGVVVITNHGRLDRRWRRRARVRGI